MSGRVFVDTNILVYAHDVDAAAKHETANRLVRELWTDSTGVISPQVLQEFYVTVTRKIASPISKSAARIAVSTYEPWCIDMAVSDLEMAFRIEDEAKLSFWDALIVAAAVKSGSNTLITEDLNHRQKIAGIQIVNPFV